MLLCANCKLLKDNTPVRVVLVNQTDNHYIEVCATCAIDLCEASHMYRRIAQQPEAEQTQ